MNSDISVSVIVPVYNAERDLKKCLESIRRQTLENIEIILIDDGSTDGSTQICLDFQKSDSRVVYYRKENEGLAAARQDGIERAHGKFVGFVDSDDWIEPNMYERMYSEAEKENADVVLCGIYVDETGKNPFYLAPGVYDRKRIEEEILTRSLAGISPKGNKNTIRWSNWSRIYSLDLIRKNNIAFDRRFRRCQDLQLTFETALAANKYISLDEYLYHNRTVSNGNSLSRGYTKNFLSLLRPLIDRLYADVRGYSKQNLLMQMHLCAFFFAADIVLNEFYLSDYSRKEKIKKLEEIGNDAVIKSALPYVPLDKLNNYYNVMHRVLKAGNGKEMYRLLKKYDFHENKWMPFVRKVLNNRVVEPIYVKIFHKR